jgi:hypothetical protein
MNFNNIPDHGSWNTISEKLNRNFEKADAELLKIKGASVANKGYFKTLEQLTSSYPSPNAGSKAYVGLNYPYSIYLWNGSVWEYSGEKGGDESLDLSNYYTKDEAKEMFVGSDNIRMIETSYTQSQIEQMHANGTADKNTLYIALG